MRAYALALIALAVTLGACSNPMTGAPTSPTPAATVTPSPTPTPIPSPTVVNGQIVVSNLDPDGAAVVAGILYPPTGGGCSTNGKYEACPVTDGLAQRLDSNPLKAAQPLCPFQNTYQSRTLHSTSSDRPPGWMSQSCRPPPAGTRATPVVPDRMRKRPRSTPPSRPPAASPSPRPGRSAAALPEMPWRRRDATSGRRGARRFAPTPPRSCRRTRRARRRNETGRADGRGGYGQSR